MRSRTLKAVIRELAEMSPTECSRGSLRFLWPQHSSHGRTGQALPDYVNTCNSPSLLSRSSTWTHGVGANIVRFTILRKVLVRDAYRFDINATQYARSKLNFSRSGLSPTLHNVGELKLGQHVSVLCLWRFHFNDVFYHRFGAAFIGMVVAATYVSHQLVFTHASDGFSKLTWRYIFCYSIEYVIISVHQFLVSRLCITSQINMTVGILSFR